MTHTTEERRPVVLVAEDDRDILELVRFRLERSGYETVCARDGEEALRLACDCCPDIAVIDVMMPKHNGYDVTRRLRADQRTEHLPVLLLTARVRDDDIERGFEAGADDYLEKPFSPEELRARVAAILDGSGTESKVSSSRGAGAGPGRWHVIGAGAPLRRDGAGVRAGGEARVSR
jgi:DNA-binding response OmpR family regulator